MSKKQSLIIFGIAGLISLGVAVFLGGSETWKVLSASPNEELSEEALLQLEQRLGDSDNTIHGKYNLSAIYFKQQKFEEASSLLRELLESGELDASLVDRIHFNLGDSLYRMAEQEKDPAESLDLLTKSLAHFRIIIDREEQEEKYSNSPIKRDEDALFNYTLIRKKLKILRDRLEQEKREQAKNKQLYRMLKELKDRETEIAEQLDSMKKDPLSKDTLQTREKLLEKRKNNLEQLKLIKEKMLQAVQG